MDFSCIVHHYIHTHRERARREIRFYSIQRSLSRAIHEAALARLPSGKRHPHQRRIPADVLLLARAEQALQRSAQQLRRAKDFATLHGEVERQIGCFSGIGALAAYDMAHRIGAFLKLQPEHVYLHAGTRDGARVLGLRGKRVDPSKLPREFQKLTPAEMEDCLCIYKDELRTRGSSSRTCCP
jgi:hypothetical protein